MKAKTRLRRLWQHAWDSRAGESIAEVLVALGLTLAICVLGVFGPIAILAMLITDLWRIWTSKRISERAYRTKRHGDFF